MMVRPQIERILCPVDFSEFSAPAVRHSVRLARWFSARVEVLHVVPRSPFGLAGGGVPEALETVRAIRETAERELAELVEPLLGEGVPIETRLLEGEAWRVIVDEAESTCPDLLILGTHGRGGFEHLLLGSVTEKVLRRAPCPVLTVGRLVPVTHTGPLFRRILCAVDLSDASTRTLENALALGRESDAQITLLHVIASLPDELEGRRSLAVADVGPLRERLVDEASKQLRAAVPHDTRQFFDVSERVESGTPWTEILRAAGEMEADLIVMGAHTRGAIGRMLFGSTANQVVRRATCPVLIVREARKVGPYAANEATGRLTTA